LDTWDTWMLLASNLTRDHAASVMLILQTFS